MSLIDDVWAQTIDGFSFGFINALQIRLKAGRLTRADFMRYVEAWENKTLEEYYALPTGLALPELPDSGCVRLPTPHPSGCVENDHLHLDLWLGPKGWASPCMFLLHGVMSVSDVGYRLWAKALNKQGWTAAFFHLPYHYGRRPRGAMSGEMALTSNLVRTAEGIRQAVIELRWIIAGLKAKGTPHIGLWGTSYGGWISGLLIVLENQISTAWLLEPIADVDLAVWQSPATITLRRQLRKEGITREDTSRLLHLVCPGMNQPLLDPKNILLVGGIFDKIAPVDSLRALNQKWAGSRYAEFRQGHVGYQLMPQSLRLAKEAYPGLFTPGAS